MNKLTCVFLSLLILLSGCATTNQMRNNLDAVLTVYAGDGPIGQTFSAVAMGRVSDGSYLYLSVAHGCLDVLGNVHSEVILSAGATNPEVTERVGLGHILAVDRAKDLCLIRTFMEPEKFAYLGLKTPEALDEIYFVGSPNGLDDHLVEGLFLRSHETHLGRMGLSNVPTVGGASGGGVFDSDGKLIGIIRAYAAPFYPSGSFVELPDVRTFLAEVSLAWPEDKLAWGKPIYLR